MDSLTHVATSIRNSVVALAVLAFIVAGSPAYAVVKQSQLVTGTDGKPLASQTIVITAPDGSTEEKDTDEAGMLFWDADQDGTYVLKPKAGGPAINVNVTGAAGGGGFNWAPVLALGAGVAAVGLAASSQDSSSGGGSHGGGGEDCVAGDCVGTWNIATASVTFNPDSHPNLFPGSSCAVTLNGSNLNLACSGAGYSVAFTSRPLQSGCRVTGTATGTYSGFNTAFEIDVTFDPVANTWSGTFSAGTNGTLPGGDPIRVNISGGRTT